MAKYPAGWVSGRCYDCGAKIHGRDRQTLRCDKCSAQAYTLRRRAINAISSAIARGTMPPASSVDCVDCGARAEHYDHRDYRKPLDVQPVCRSCNFNRGPAAWRNYAEAV